MNIESRAFAMVLRIRELHAPHEKPMPALEQPGPYNPNRVSLYCQGCEAIAGGINVPWPCPTIKTMDLEPDKRLAAAALEL